MAFWNTKQTDNDEWQRKMLERWTDLEARVRVLEKEDVEMRKITRRKVTGSTETKDLYAGMLIPET